MRPNPTHANNGSRRWMISFGISGLMALAASWWLGLLPSPSHLLQLSSEKPANNDKADAKSSTDETALNSAPADLTQWEPGAAETRPELVEEHPKPTLDPVDLEPGATADPFPPESSEPKRPPLFADDTSAFEPQQTVTANAAPAFEPTPEIVPVAAENALPQTYVDIDALIEQGKFLEAHRDLSKLYWSKPEEMELILPRVEQTAKIIYLSPQPHFMEPYVIQSGDLLQKISPNYNISWEYLAKLNRVQPEKIRAGQKLKVIKGPFSAFIDLSEFRLTIHAHGYFVKQYAIGIGKGNSTPIGTFAVKDKLRNPVYYGPDGVVAADDPTNPLGECWVDLGDSYGIHGTINPDSIGKAESRGCVRLVAADVAEVYDFLTIGSEVVIRP